MKTTTSLSKGVVISLWAAQGLLAALFLSGAFMKLVMPAEKLAAMWPWTAENRKLVLITAIFDAMIGFGLILPTLLGILPQLTFYAALGGVALMGTAIVFHVSRGEASQMGINVFAGIVCLFIAWGRKV